MAVTPPPSAPRGTLTRVPIHDLFEGMNKTEKRRAMELEALRRSGQIAAWWYERWTFKLAHDCRWTPDFVVQENSGALRIEEIKGFWRDDALVKTRVAASLFPIPIKVYKFTKLGAWSIEDVKHE